MNAAVMSGQPEQAGPLSRAERMELTWALSWPCVLFSLAYDVFRRLLQLSEAQLQALDFVCAALSFFLVSTLVVWRTVRMDFPCFHLVVVRCGTPEVARTMRYRETLSVTWLIGRRSAAICVLPWLALTLLLRHRLDVYGPLGWLFNSVAELLVFYVWIVQAALNKSYAGFPLRLARSVLRNA